MSFWALSGLINALVSSGFGFFVYLKNRTSPINRHWAIFSSTVAFWSYSYFFWQISNERSLALFWCHSLMVGAIFIPVTCLHFLLVWLKVNHAKKKVLFISYGISLIAFILNFTPLFVKDVRPISYFKFWPEPGVTYLPFLIFWAWLVFYCLYIMFQAMRISTGIRRNQIKYVLFSTIIGFCGGFTNYPLWFGIKIPPYGNILVSVYVAIMGYAIYKYGLLDIELAGKVVLARAFSLISLGSIAFGCLFIFGKLSGLEFNSLFILVAIVLTLILSLFYHPLQAAFSKLFKVRVDYRPALQQYTDTGLTSAYDVKQLSNSMVKTLTDTLKMESCSLMLLDRDKKQYCINSFSGFKEPVPELSLEESSPLISFLKRKANSRIAIKDEIDKILPREEANLVSRDLEKIRANISLPLFMKDKLMGILNLGSKRSGEVYTPEEIIFISTVGKESAVIIQLFGVIEAYQAGRIRTESLKIMAQLLGAIYHEIRNLLVSISSFIQLFRANLYKTKEDLEQALEMSSFDIQRALAVAEAVGVYRKNSESKEVKLENIAKTIDKALSRAKEGLPSAKIEVSIDIPLDLPQVQGRLTFSDLFFNLIMNSYYAMDARGGGRLRIKAKRIKDETRPIEVQISDTGGYLSEVMKEGTDFGGEESPERSGVGGINFFLAKLITNDHAATLEVIDNQEGGTTFIVRLPLTQPQEPEI